MAIGGLFPNVTDYAARNINGENSDLVPPGLLGISHDYQNLSTWIDENVKPDMRDQLFKTDSQCVLSNTLQFSYTNIGDYFKNGVNSILYDEIPNSALYWAGTMGLRGTPRASLPLYYYQSASDEVTPVNLTDNLWAKQCADGASIEYERNVVPGVTHTGESLIRILGALHWLMDRHNQVPPATGCSVRNISSNIIDMGEAVTFGQSIMELLQALWQKEIGPNPQ